MTTWDRRALLAGLAAAAGARGASAETSAFPLMRGALARNRLAGMFRAAPAGLVLPGALRVADLGGVRPLSAYRGRTLLVSLWAEWCTPCLVEMPDFADLQRRYGNARFEILPILTGSKKKVAPRGAAQLLAKVKAGGFAPLVETGAGDRLFKTLAVDSGHGEGPTLPANLIVDPSGQVVARQFGFVSVGQGPAPPGAKPGKTLSTKRLTTKDKRQMLAASAAGGGMKGVWSTPAAAAFAQALAAGFLDRA